MALSVAPRAVDDASIMGFAERFDRRVKATPPGMCPIAMQVSLLEASAAQTCGKCIPCRDGIPRILSLMRAVLNGEADSQALVRMRILAEMVRDTSDCAIGYEAAAAVLEGMEAFSDEYRSHVDQHACLHSVGQTVPCETDCPAHVDVPAYIALAGQGRCADAVNMVRKDNPFPTACALVCEHPCEARCRRTLIDAPINIRGIKKYAVDQAPVDTVAVPARSVDTGRRIAVVGGGPSGMTCAYFLALMGHNVVVLEMRDQLGGMLRYGIPAYRFPRQRLDQDIDGIMAVGNIEVRRATKVDAAAMRRLNCEYDAVYVAIGAQLGKTLKLDGMDASGVVSAVDLLGRIGDGEIPDYAGKKVVVIGGGNVAMDCARTAVRAGAAEVSVAYRRRLEDMTALPAEVESAMAEGIEMLTLQAPVRIEADADGACTALITQPQYIGPVKRGRPAPLVADKPELAIEADVVLVAVGQDIESAPFEEFGMKAEWNQFIADNGLAAQDMDGIFVGGDCQTGPSTVIRAIAAGKVAARNIDEYLGYHHKLEFTLQAPAAVPNDRTPTGRVNIAERPARERVRDFDYVEVDMSKEEALQECNRCLRCDHFGCGTLEGGRIRYE